MRLICSPSGAVITAGTTLSVMVPPNKKCSHRALRQPPP
jgi:hypothetical protein